MLLPYWIKNVNTTVQNCWCGYFQTLISYVQPHDIKYHKVNSFVRLLRWSMNGFMCLALTINDNLTTWWQHFVEILSSYFSNHQKTYSGMQQLFTSAVQYSTLVSVTLMSENSCTQYLSILKFFCSLRKDV